MEIRFLGTGAGDFPELVREENQNGFLPRARRLGGRNVRGAASVHLSPNILIDFYDDSGLRAQNVPVTSIRHLLVTHGHWDHVRPSKVLEFAGGLPHCLEVYGNEKVKRALEFAGMYRWEHSTGRFRSQTLTGDINYRELRPYHSYSVGDSLVTPVHANHSIDKKNMLMEELAYNYIIESGGKTVFYGLDSSYLLPQTSEFLRAHRFDVAVLDATFGEMAIDPYVSGHHNFAMLEQTIAELREQETLTESTVVVASHISVQHVAPHDDIVEKLAGQGIVLAYDGLLLEV